MSNVSNGLANLATFGLSLFGLQQSATPTPSPVPTATLAPWAAANMQSPYNNVPQPFIAPQPVCSVVAFTYTTTAPLVEVTRSHAITRVVNTTIFQPVVTSTTIVEFETLIARRGGTPTLAVAQTTRCDGGYPSWQTVAADQQQYQPNDDAQRQNDIYANQNNQYAQTNQQDSAYYPAPQQLQNARPNQAKTLAAAHQNGAHQAKTKTKTSTVWAPFPSSNWLR